ncbi:ring-2 protein [Ophiostoma piceae UAMH 11346]|uniref:Methylated-DNA--protein-cysteine methyltransferase n=1 Tax=Ophiostoma piceae (strain UAMH 11346) TaxID=1262450 RepID=S3C8U5_OPHP1|nr:ring-2 protein [Ophiostoma piceae UAMH 11346]
MPTTMKAVAMSSGSSGSSGSSDASTSLSPPASSASASPSHMDRQLQRIAASNRTPFEKRVWLLLCQIPAGHVTTYAKLAAHLGSSPRAVGNAMRRNPFAPDVPCHRCVATGGGLGGFKGVGPVKATKKGKTAEKEGITLTEKRSLLRKEGVRFDDRGRVLGTPFQAFK